ncbi:MAG: helix-turn-helix transcriptional regulator [Pseudomonas fluorescens]
MASPQHDTLGIRLAEILLQLNQGDAVCRDDLADRFGVSERTIYRDLNRLGDIVERLPDGRYRLAADKQGKFHSKDLELFARITGVNQLFPNSGHRFLRTLLDPLEPSPFLVKAHHHENIQPRDRQFQQLDRAIRQRLRCQLQYGEKLRTLEPYRLVNSKGIWYLAATERGQLKAFSLGRIGLLHITDEIFTPQAQIHRQIEDDDDIWFSTTKTQVRLSVAPAIAYYFLRRAVLPGQLIVQQGEDGGLIVSSSISHANQILPIIRYWIPHVQVLEPEWLQSQLHVELENYIQTASQPHTGS